MNPKAQLDAIVARGKSRFDAQRTVMSFEEFLEAVLANPARHLRGAAGYVMDALASFGTRTVSQPTGEVTRYNVFDRAMDAGVGGVVGQERVQENVLRLLRNFERAGRVDRLVLLHGPNGSAKTSIVQTVSRAAELYSHTEEGAVYRFNWVFPVAKVRKGPMGFGGAASSAEGSFAYLEPDAIAARLPCEHRDHPLLLLPTVDRAAFLEAARDALGDDGHTIPDVLTRGDLSAKNRQIFDALLTAYQGDVRAVWQHVQVERFYLSRRYRQSIATVEPQLSVDAHARQVTADRSLGALPASLQHLSLFETGGALSDGNRGIVEYNDLLKRPVDAWKYLLVATEQAHVSLDAVSMFIDAVLLASSNELHLTAFKEYPDWQSFKGRFELVTVPYLLRVSDEVGIYEHQIPAALEGVHIAPHALQLAARWAVLTRLEPPRPERYASSEQDLVASLTPEEKLELYDSGAVPERLSQRERRELRRLARHLYREYDDDVAYEGMAGASAREIRTVLLNAAQNKRFNHLSPIAVLDELRALSKETSSYPFLRREPARGYRDATSFIDAVEAHFRQVLAREVRQAMGLVEQASHRAQFMRYVRHVSAWIKKERLPDPVTGALVDPDAALMLGVEDVLKAKDESAEEFRKSLIGQIGAHKLEHPEDDVDYDLLFQGHLRRLEEAFFASRQDAVRRLEADLLAVLDNEAAGLDAKQREQAEAFRANLHALGYNDDSARQAIAFLLSTPKRD